MAIRMEHGYCDRYSIRRITIRRSIACRLWPPTPWRIGAMRIVFGDATTRSWSVMPAMRMAIGKGRVH